MAFPRDKVAQLLADVHRRCCVCHRWCGTKIETDHIVPKAEGGGDEIDNAIPVCFDCHAEIHAYNDQHPRGRKFTADELRLHKQQWLRVCEDAPAALATNPTGEPGVGPIQALIDELYFNRSIASRNADARATNGRGAQFVETQLTRAIELGAIAVLEDHVRDAILAAYAAMAAANQWIIAEIQEWVADYGAGRLAKHARRAIDEAAPRIDQAIEALLRCLQSEP